MTRNLLVLLTLTLMAVVSGCVTILPTIRYRLTVVLDTPEGRRSGSAVMELTSYISSEFPGAESGGLRFRLHGEAVPIRLANGNYIFVVRKWASGPDEALAMLQSAFSDSIISVSPNLYGDARLNALEKQIRQLSVSKGQGKVPRKYYPIVAYFRDISNPDTILSAGAGRVEDLIPNVRVVSMTIKMTSEPITVQIESIIPWLKTFNNGYLDPFVRQHPSAMVPRERLLDHDDFISK